MKTKIQKLGKLEILIEPELEQVTIYDQLPGAFWNNGTIGSTWMQLIAVAKEYRLNGYEILLAGEISRLPKIADKYIWPDFDFFAVST